MTYDFKAWLKLQPDDVTYEYKNVDGDCAVGRYIASRGEEWDFQRYLDVVRHEVDGDHAALTESKTYGELKRALELA